MPEDSPQISTAEADKPQEQQEEQKTQEAETEEITSEDVEFAKATRGGSALNLLSPESVIMLMIAAMLDLAGIVLICVGLDDFGITDIIGVLVIGGWMLLRGSMSSGDQELTARQLGREAAQKRGERQQIVKRAKSITKRGWLKPFCFIGELIPWVGALPFWVVMVYNELKNQ